MESLLWERAIASLSARPEIDVIISGGNSREILPRYRAADIGGLLENIVFLELVRRHYTVTIGKVGDLEGIQRLNLIDFLVNGAEDGN